MEQHAIAAQYMTPAAMERYASLLREGWGVTLTPARFVDGDPSGNWALVISVERSGVVATVVSTMRHGVWNTEECLRAAIERFSRPAPVHPCCDRDLLVGP